MQDAVLGTERVCLNYGAVSGMHVYDVINPGCHGNQVYEYNSPFLFAFARGLYPI